MLAYEISDYINEMSELANLARLVEVTLIQLTSTQTSAGNFR
jgi:hypothetical protein